MGRKTKLHDWKEIISTQEKDIIDLLQTYRDHCSYNVGVGPTLGGFAVELEETL